jgi:hypothetical protein
LSGPLPAISGAKLAKSAVRAASGTTLSFG